MPENGKEVTFYSDSKGVRVTNTRLIVRNTTYAMAVIASVRANVKKPKNRGSSILWGTGFALVGLLFVYKSFPYPGIFCLALAALLGLLTALRQPTYVVRVTSASGDGEPIEDRSRLYCEQVVEAINQAIIHRG
ncbi:MAG: DUF6232 family protein [Terriglobia bacterium]